MDCRKARYFLVVSFDGDLKEEERTTLSYHLKDCKKCRHEAFYYRELFSAKESLAPLIPSADFNERLMASIRLREAQAGWPAQPQTRRISRRWRLALVPPVFVAAAAAAFLIFTIGARDTAETPDLAVTTPNSATEVVPEATPLPEYVASSVSPRYKFFRAPVETRGARTYRIIDPSGANTMLPEHEFIDQLEQLVGLYQDAPLTARQRTQYVLPVVDNAQPKERIY